LTTRLRAMTVQQFTLAFSMLTQQLSTRDLTYSSFTFHMILHKLLKYDYLMTTCLHLFLIVIYPLGSPRAPGVSGSTPESPGVKIQNGGGFPSCSLISPVLNPAVIVNTHRGKNKKQS